MNSCFWNAGITSLLVLNINSSSTDRSSCSSRKGGYFQECFSLYLAIPGIFGVLIGLVFGSACFATLILSSWDSVAWISNIMC